MYAIALNEITRRVYHLDKESLQSLLVGLLGDPVQAKIARRPRPSLNPLIRAQKSCCACPMLVALLVISLQSTSFLVHLLRSPQGMAVLEVLKISLTFE